MARISIPRVNDHQLLKIFIDETLLKLDEDAFSNQQPYVQFFIGSNVFRVDVNSLDDDEFIKATRKDKALTTRITRVQLVAQSLHAHCNFSYFRLDGGFVDQLDIPDQNLSTRALEVAAHLNKLLLKHAEKAFGTKGGNSLDVSEAHHNVLSSLEGLNAELIAKQHDFIHKLEKEKQEFLTERAKEYADKLNKLDDAHSEKQNLLEHQYLQRSLELDERQKLIEDADNTTTRRKTTTKTLEDAQKLAKKFNFSQSVTYRTAISGVFALILVLIGAFSSFYTLDSLNSVQTGYSNYLATWARSVQNQDNYSPKAPIYTDITKQQIYFLYVRLFFSSALLISSIVYLIKWNNSWAGKIAEQELENQRFVRDLNRAQMAVEMSLEWNEKKDGDVPDRLLEALTEGLFTTKESNQSEVLHPAEQVAAAMLKASDRINIPFGKANLEMSGKKLSKMKTTDSK